MQIVSNLTADLNIDIRSNRFAILNIRFKLLSTFSLSSTLNEEHTVENLSPGFKYSMCFSYCENGEQPVLSTYVE